MVVVIYLFICAHISTHTHKHMRVHISIYIYACESRCPPTLGGPSHTSQSLCAPYMGTSIKCMPMKPISPQMSHDIGTRFLDLFQDSKSLGKDALKFVKTFAMSVSHTDSTTVGTKEDFWPMGKILEHYGQSLKDYPNTDDALAAVRHLCALNREEHGYSEKPEQLDDKFPSFSKFWFVMGQGKTCLHTSNVEKKLEQHADIKNLAQLEETKLFLEGMGFKDEADKSSVQVENAKAGETKKLVELLKCS